MRFFLLCLSLLVLSLTPPVSTQRASPDGSNDGADTPDEERSTRLEPPPIRSSKRDVRRDGTVIFADDEDYDNPENNNDDSHLHDTYKRLKESLIPSKEDAKIAKEAMELREKELNATKEDEAKKTQEYEDAKKEWERLNELADPLDAQYREDLKNAQFTNTEWTKAKANVTKIKTTLEKAEKTQEELDKEILEAEELKDDMTEKSRYDDAKREKEKLERKISDANRKSPRLTRANTTTKDAWDSAARILEAEKKIQHNIDNGCDQPTTRDKNKCASFINAEKAVEDTQKEFEKVSSKLDEVNKEISTETINLKNAEDRIQKYENATPEEKEKAKQNIDALQKRRESLDEIVKKAIEDLEPAENEEIKKRGLNDAAQNKRRVGPPENSKEMRKNATDASAAMHKAERIKDAMPLKVKSAHDFYDAARLEYIKKQWKADEIQKEYDRRTINFRKNIPTWEREGMWWSIVLGSMIGGLLLLLFCCQCGLFWFGQYYVTEFFWKRRHIKKMRDVKYTKEQLEELNKIEDENSDKIKPFRYWRLYVNQVLQRMEIDEEKRTFWYRSKPNIYGFDRVHCWTYMAGWRQQEKLKYFDCWEREWPYQMPAPGRRAMDELMNARKIQAKLQRDRARHRMEVARYVDFANNGVLVERAVEPNEFYVYPKGHKHIRWPKKLRRDRHLLRRFLDRTRCTPAHKHRTRLGRLLCVNRSGAPMHPTTDSIARYTNRYVKKVFVKNGSRLIPKRPRPRRKVFDQYFYKEMMRFEKFEQRFTRKDKRFHLRLKRKLIKQRLRQIIKSEIPATIEVLEEHGAMSDEVLERYEATIKRLRLMLKFLDRENVKRKKKNVKWVTWNNQKSTKKMKKKRKHGRKKKRVRKSKKDGKKNGKRTKKTKKKDGKTKRCNGDKLYVKRKKVRTKKVKKAKIDNDKRNWKLAKNAKKLEYKKLTKEEKALRKLHKKLKQVIRLPKTGKGFVQKCQAFLAVTEHCKEECKSMRKEATYRFYEGLKKNAMCKAYRAVTKHYKGVCKDKSLINNMKKHRRDASRALLKTMLEKKQYMKALRYIKPIKADCTRLKERIKEEAWLMKRANGRPHYPGPHRRRSLKTTEPHRKYHTRHHKHFTAHHAFHTGKKEDFMQKKEEERTHAMYEKMEEKRLIKKAKDNKQPPPPPKPKKKIRHMKNVCQKKRDEQELKERRKQRKHKGKKAKQTKTTTATKKHKKHHKKVHKRKKKGGGLGSGEARIPTIPDPPQNREPSEDQTQADNTEIAPIFVMNEVVNPHEDPTQTQRNATKTLTQPVQAIVVNPHEDPTQTQRNATKTLTQPVQAIVVDEGPPMVDRTQAFSRYSLMLAPDVGVDKSEDDKTQATKTVADEEGATKKTSKTGEEKKPDKPASGATVFRV